jgi:hypothetical protein
MIGTKINKPTKIEEYIKVAEWCNENNATIEDKGSYFEVVAVVPHTPTLQEQLETLEAQYKMNRWQREIILAQDSGASDYVKAKAQEIENIAEQIRKGE